MPKNPLRCHLTPLRLQPTWERERRTEELGFVHLLLKGSCRWLDTCCPHENGITYSSTLALIARPCKKRHLLASGSFFLQGLRERFQRWVVAASVLHSFREKKKICCMIQTHPASSQHLLFLPLRFCIQYPYSNNSISSLPFFTFISS